MKATNNLQLSLNPALSQQVASDTKHKVLCCGVCLKLVLDCQTEPCNTVASRMQLGQGPTISPTRGHPRNSFRK